MCGIAGIYLKDSFSGQYDVEGLVDGLFLGIEPRGRDATGIVSVSKGGKDVALHKDNIEAHHFILLRPLLQKDMRFALCHTRLGTKGPDEDMENNHPVQFKTCFATHNGVIWNDDALFRTELEGVDRVAEVDSIVVPTLITEKGGMEKALEVLPKLKGSWACAIADPVNSPDEVLLVRGEKSPLIVLNHPKLVMWASTRTAIEDAWKLAVGTPPKFNKYQEVKEGEYVRIKEGGSVETGRFIEERKYSGSFRTPHDWESGSGVRHYPGSQNPMCFECGKRVAMYSVTDSIKDSESGRVVEWDVPVCFQCRETLADNLTYAHAQKDAKVRLRYQRPGGADEPITCELCQHADAVGKDRNGTDLCKRCLEYEKEWKPVATFRGDDPNAEKFLTLRPGDNIPMEMRSAFPRCEKCENKLVAYIGKDGFAICGLCHLEETEGLQRDEEGEGIDCIQCDMCEAWVPAAGSVVSCFGTVCGECCDKNGWARGDEDACGVEVVKRDETPAATLLGYIREAEQMYPIGTKFTAMVEEISTELSIHIPFVAWLLKGCCQDHLADPALKPTYDRVQTRAAEKVMEAANAEGSIG